MDLYERIKSPLDDDKTIEELAKIYAEKGKIDYNDIVHNGESTDIDKKKQIEEFNKNILKECIEMEAERLKQLEKKHDISLYTKARNEKLKVLEDKLEEFRKSHYDVIEAYKKCKKVFEETGKIITNISSYELNKENLKKYNITEDDFYGYLEYQRIEEDEYLLEKEIKSFKEENPDYDVIMKTLNKYTSEEIIEMVENPNVICEEEVGITWDYIESKHTQSYIMGFHINKRRFEDVDKTQKIDESKLYINADYDQVYKIARLYLEKAKERGINYNFKVNYPRYDDKNRTDKFVVFSSLKELTKNVEILDEIMREHPEFTLKNPGLLVGKLENGIGIGMDSERKSYNNRRSKFLNNVFEKIFKGKSLDEVKEMINSEEGIVAKIRNKIKSALTESEISTEKFCIDKEKEEDFKKITGKDVVMDEKKVEQQDKEQDEKKEGQPRQQDEKKEEQPKQQQDEKKEEQPKQQQDEKKEEQPKQQQDEKKEKQPKQQQDEKKEEQPKQQQDEKKEEQPKQQQDEKEERQQEEESENQRKMQALVKNLNKLTKNMARDYINANYENEPKNREIYQNIINTMVKLRVLEGGTKISKLDMMMEKRRLDAIVSNLVFAYRDHEKSLKSESDTEKSEKNVKYELKKLDEFLKSDI